MKLNQRILSITLYLSPISWLLGLNIVFFHYVSLIQFLSSSKKIKFDKVKLLLILIITFYVISLLFNFTFGLKPEFKRTIGSIYNLSFWIYGYLIYSSVQSFSYNKLCLEMVNKASLFLILFIGLILIFSVLIIGGDKLLIDSFIGSIINTKNLPDIITNSLKLNIYGINYSNYETNIRGSVMAPYSTIMGATIILLIPYILSGLKQKRLIFKIIIMLISLYIIYMAKSRGVILSLFIYFILMFYFSFTNKIMRMLVFSCLLIIGFLYAYDSIYKSFEALLSYRSDSTDLRFILYAESFDLLFKNNVFIGLSVKPESNIFNVPLGSHSTYIGLLVRVGIIGFILFTLLQFFIIKRALSVKTNFFSFKAHLSYVMVSVSFFLMFEDLDVPQFFNYLYFVNLGFLFNRNYV